MSLNNSAEEQLFLAPAKQMKDKCDFLVTHTNQTCTLLDDLLKAASSRMQSLPIQSRRPYLFRVESLVEQVTDEFESITRNIDEIRPIIRALASEILAIDPTCREEVLGTILSCERALDLNAETIRQATQRSSDQISALQLA